MSPLDTSKQTSVNLPSKRWTYFDGWDYNGMKEGLQAALDSIDKSALLRHAERIKKQKVVKQAVLGRGVLDLLRDGCRGGQPGHCTSTPAPPSRHAGDCQRRKMKHTPWRARSLRCSL